ncbi:MAG: SagB/ThcOx family dehydrogenase [Deltaproteobacteria bacterium]|nr:SagB/ThcOx family dehydrogenase [Deltaproteobacteria bacterium]
MNWKLVVNFCVTVLLALMLSGGVLAQESKPISLPQPQLDGGKPLMQVLKARKTSREFSDQKISEQVLSNLLWAAFGINRPDSGRRTAPSSFNRQEMDVYVAAPEGLFLYDAKEHSLKPILSTDIRAQTGRQNTAKEAAMNLVYVADLAKMGDAPEAEKIPTAWADAAFICQNVYLFCASEGLATGVRAAIDRDALAKTMKLRPDQRITLAQHIGYPKK